MTVPVLQALRFDSSPRHRQPALVRLVVATIVAVGGSLGVDAVLVRVGTALFPSTRGYDHFHFADYSKLTVIGVVIACAGWPVVTRLCAAPRWLFLRLAILVTVVLLLPDVYILMQGQPARAVAVLMLMHLAIAVVTYLALVLISPVRTTQQAERPIA
jgi:hypothetical protein